MPVLTTCNPRCAAPCRHVWVPNLRPLGHLVTSCSGRAWSSICHADRRLNGGSYGGVFPLLPDCGLECHVSMRPLSIPSWSVARLKPIFPTLGHIIYVMHGMTSPYPKGTSC